MERWTLTCLVSNSITLLLIFTVQNSLQNCMRLSIIGSPICSVGNTHSFNEIMWNKESRNDIKSLVWYDEWKFIHMHCVPAPFVILQISQKQRITSNSSRKAAGCRHGTNVTALFTSPQRLKSEGVRSLERGSYGRGPTHPCLPHLNSPLIDSGIWQWRNGCWWQNMVQWVWERSWSVLYEHHRV